MPSLAASDPDPSVDLETASILVVDDEPGMRNFLLKSLGDVCGQVDAAANTSEASNLLDGKPYDVIILDNVMPKQSGLDWLVEQQRIGLFSDAILMTAFADLDTAIAAIRAGASDFVLKPFRSNQIINAISKSLQRTQLRRQNSVLRHELREGADVLRHRTALLGTSAEIQTVRDTIQRAATSPAHVVIRGEVGSGKQIAARMLHASSPRADKPFVWLQCHGLSEDAFEERLFGRLSDANGQPHTQAGILTNAAGGTLFLDDIDLLPMPAQALLVELISTGRYRPMGAQRSMRFDVRLVSSTTGRLRSAVEAKRFRTDLFYLLNVVEMRLPPLRERSGDVLDLADFLIAHLSTSLGIEAPQLSGATRRKILAYPWPGNVMELRNYVERALIHNDFDYGIDSAPEEGEQETLAAVEQRHILRTLEACEGNRAEAARRLGVARKTIDRKCQAWGL